MNNDEVPIKINDFKYESKNKQCERISKVVPRRKIFVSVIQFIMSLFK